MPRPRLGAALAFATVLLVGCGQAAPLNVGGEMPSPAAAPRAVDAAPLSPVATTGRLELRLSGLGGRYQVQATVSQVARLRVTLSGGPLATPLTREVATAQLANGQGTVAFEAVPHGTVAVKVEALDADGVRLGLKETSAVIVKGETAVVSATLKLEATHVVSENGGLALDLVIEDGEIVVDPIASPSPRPSSPVLDPAASPLPVVSPAVVLVGTPASTWYGDGTMGVSGSVKNQFATTQVVSVEVAFKARTVIGYRTVETRTVEVGQVTSKATKAFTVRSTKKVSNWLGDGKAEFTVTTP